MKTLPLAVLLLTATVALADPATPEPKASVPTTSNQQIDASVTVTTTKSTRIKRGSVTYGGAAATAVRAKNPLQLINPFAPMSYGSGEENVNRDPITGEARGINLASVGR